MQVKKGSWCHWAKKKKKLRKKLTTSGIRTKEPSTYMQGLTVHTIGDYKNTRPAKACKCFLPDILSSHAGYWSATLHNYAEIVRWVNVIASTAVL